MTKEKTAIGPWLLVPILIISAIGHGMLNMPRFAVKAMGNNAYWAYPIAVLLFIIPAMAVIYLLAKRFPGQTLIDQGKSILGPVLGTITGLGYLGFLLLFLATLTRDIVNLASMYYLYTTPVYILALVYFLAAAYLASRGIETITRTASLMLIPGVLIILFLGFAGYQNVTWDNLRPVFTPNLFDYLKGAKGAMQNFYILGLTALVLPYLKPLNSFPRYIGGVILLLLALFLILAVGTIGVLGPDFLLRVAYPCLGFFRYIQLPYLLLEQTGMVIGIAWLVIILVGSGFGHYTLALGFSQLAPFWDYKAYVWILAPLKYLIIILPPGILLNKMMVDFVAQNGWIFFFGYPLFLWIVALIFRKKGGDFNAA